MIQKNGIISTQRFSTNGLLDNMEIKYFDNAVWAKVFEHNNHAGTILFTTIAEVKYSNTTDKYSRIKSLDSFKATDGKIEFLLEYPDDLSGKYNRWKQTNNPCDEFVTTTSTGDGKAEGYEAVHIDWSTNYWGGLTRQNSDVNTLSPTYLSGSVGHTNWFYAIGSASAWSGGIPSANVAATGRAQLWVRIDTLPTETKCQVSKKECITSTDFYEV